MGNQLTWIERPAGRSQVLCGLSRRSAHSTLTRGLKAMYRPLKLLPDGYEFRYRAKAWFKGSLPGDLEERTRTVHAVNLIAR